MTKFIPAFRTTVDASVFKHDALDKAKLKKRKAEFKALSKEDRRPVHVIKITN